MKFKEEHVLCFDGCDFNPYGIRKNDKLLNYEGTVDFFREMDVTEEELLALNEYIMESPFHSFYDNPFCSFEDGWKENYINGYRSSCDEESSPSDLLERDIRDIILAVEAECTNGETTWKARLKNYTAHDDYVYLEIEGMGSCIRTYYVDTEEYWVMFPEFDLGATLTYPEDVRWNVEKLTRVFGNEYDATTVSFILREYEKVRKEAFMLSLDKSVSFSEYR